MLGDITESTFLVETPLLGSKVTSNILSLLSSKRNENADLHMNGRSHFLHNSLRNNPNVQQHTNE